VVGGVKTTDGRRKTSVSNEEEEEDGYEPEPDDKGDDDSTTPKRGSEKPGKQPVKGGTDHGFIQIINIPPYDRNKWRSNQNFLKMLIDMMKSPRPICWRIRNDPNNPGFQSTEMFGNVSDALATAQKGDYIYYVQNGIINIIVVGDAGNYSQQADKELTDEVLSAMQVPETPDTQEPLTAEELQEAVNNGEAIEAIVNEHNEVTFRWNGTEYPASAFGDLFKGIVSDDQREYWVYGKGGGDYYPTPAGKLIVERDDQGNVTGMHLGSNSPVGNSWYGIFFGQTKEDDDPPGDYDSFEEAVEGFMNGEIEIDDLFWYGEDVETPVTSPEPGESDSSEPEDATPEELETGWINDGPDDGEPAVGWEDFADMFEDS
jgi:hypothetical protein